MRLRAYTVSVVLSLCALSLHAAAVTQINRYATVENKPLPEQVNPLKAVQHIHFPADIKTIGEAVHYWLHYSGFHLAESANHTPALEQVLKQPLPQVDRTLGPLGIDDGLLILVGKHEFSLKTEPFTRTINFQRKGSTS
jgi:conjugative transfer region protein (TIGR03748 family)